MDAKFTRLMNFCLLGLNYNMYFIEFIIKKIKKRNEKPVYNLNPNDENQDYERCEHLFMPIDSTAEILSCTKCGTLIRRSELKNKNFFVKN